MKMKKINCCQKISEEKLIEIFKYILVTHTNGLTAFIESENEKKGKNLILKMF